ncbi:MAG: phosphoribosylanthranilate isomerase [Bryobacteraceae bacterium]|jgi:phosphoribosylanthranilate isomerase
MFVKICGITNREDALAAIDAGARAIGFIFHPPSPRYVTPEALGPWLDEIPADIWKVGVFVNEDPERIEQIAAQLNLDVAQLHGNETPERHPRRLRVWKAFRVENDRIPNPAYPAEAILLDGPGSGRIFDWTLARAIPQPVILAGGLTPENVASAVEQTHPWGVDTATGVESSPGRKDHARMKMFIKAALRS